METNTISVRGSYIEWSVIFAGAVVACALTAILVQFGTAVGLTQISPQVSADINITPGLVLSAGVWLLWVQLLSSLTGGYLAGRMRMPIANASEHERDMRDGVHGLLVWATSTLAVVAAVTIVSSLAALADNAIDETVRADAAALDKSVTIIFAFCAGATSMVSAVVSWWAATMGGDHRDNATDHTRYFSFRVIKD